MLPDFRNFVFDLDGTVWYWDRLVPGAREFLDKLHKEGKQVYFVTNNSMLSPSGFVSKLESLGIITEEFRLTCSLELILQYLRQEGARKIFCVSKKEAKEYFVREGMELSEEPDYVVVVYNDEQERLEKAAKLVSRGTPFITNATGMKWPLGGRTLPGVGVFVKKVEELSGAKAEVIGKPSDFSVSYVKNKYGLEPGETIFFGDSLKSDLEFAKKLGWAFAFVATGEYTKEDLKKLAGKKPDFVLEKLGDNNFI